MSCNITSDSIVRIPRSGQAAALAALDYYRDTANAFQAQYLREHMAKAGISAARTPSAAIAYLLGGSMDLPLNAGAISIDPATDAVVIDGFGVSYEDGDSEDPVAEVLDFLRRLAPAVVPGSVVILTFDFHHGALEEVDYRVEMGPAGITVATRTRAILNEGPWSARP